MKIIKAMFFGLIVLITVPILVLPLLGAGMISGKDYLGFYLESLNYAINT